MTRRRALWGLVWLLRIRHLVWLVCLPALIGVLGIWLAGCGTFTTSEAAYDTTAFGVWRQRGEEAGQAMRRYCLSGSVMHRMWFRETMIHNAYPAVVTVTCPEP